jgi:hypothetical protein
MSAVRDAKLTPKGYQQITDLDPAVGLTVPDGAQYVLLKAEAQAIRWCDDGTTPTTSIGMVIDVGDAFWYTGELRDILFFEDAAGAILNASYYA